MNGKKFNQKVYQKEWYEENKERILKDWKNYCINNKEKRKKQQKEYYEKHKEEIDNKQKQWAKDNPEKVHEIAKKCYKKRWKETPWVFFAYKAKYRCNKSKLYIELGIQYKLTMEEIKELWFRDKAWLLRQPSIDRKDPDGHYELSNCRFIEKDLNSWLARTQNNKLTGKFESTIKRKNDKS